MGEQNGKESMSDEHPTVQNTVITIWLNSAGGLMVSGQIGNRVMAVGLLEHAKQIVMTQPIQPTLDPNRIVSPDEVRIPPGVKLN